MAAHTRYQGQRALHPTKNLTQHAYTQGESFQFLGKAYTLQIEHHNAPVHVTLTPDNKLLVQLRKDSSSTTLQRAINTWYHKQIQRIITQLLDQWLPIMQEGPLCEIRYKTWFRVGEASSLSNALFVSTYA